MEYTTWLGLQSQTTRLLESASYCAGDWVIYGILTLYDALFQKTFTQTDNESTPSNYNSPKRLQIWAVPASLAVTEGILVSFFSSAY